MSYKASIDLNAMRATGKADLVAARLLWNTGLVAQAIWLLQQSAEKYLKCLWAQDKVFTDKTHLDCQLKCLGHNLKKIFDGLPALYRKKIKSPMWAVSLDGLRYSGSFGYSYAMFRSGEKFINDIRKLLNEKVQDHFLEWKTTSLRSHKLPKEEEKCAKAIKAVLSLTNPKTKKEKAADRRWWAAMISNL